MSPSKPNKNQPLRGQVIIPQSDLGTKLVEVGTIKRQAEDMLADLESKIKPSADPGKIGGWRQKSLDWLKRN